MSHSAPIDAQRLLADTRWLKRLARGLVADDNAADDLAQETWLAALRARAGASPAVAPAEAERSWLTGVLHNLAWKERRSHARRSAREQRGARDESLPSTGALVARAEMQRAISAAVVALDEPMRTTILLRYIEELSSAEIARRQGIPEGTVRWRVKRGLEMLREELEERRGSEWLHGCALVAGLVRAPEAAVVAGATSASATGGALAGGVGLKTAGALAAGLALTGGGVAATAHWSGLDTGSTLVADASIDQTIDQTIETAGGSGAPSIASTTSAHANEARADADLSIADEAGGAGATRIRIPLAARSDVEGAAREPSEPASGGDGASANGVFVRRDVRARATDTADLGCEGELYEGAWVYALHVDAEGDEHDIDLVTRAPFPAAEFLEHGGLLEHADLESTIDGLGDPELLPWRFLRGPQDVEARIALRADGGVESERATFVVVPLGTKPDGTPGARVRILREAISERAERPNEPR